MNAFMSPVDADEKAESQHQTDVIGDGVTVFQDI